MSGFDIVIAGIFVISMVVGIMRGLIKEALSIISWIGAIWLAITFKVTAGDWFAQFVNIPNATFRSWLGFALVFVVTLFTFAVVNYLITKLLVRGPIKATDRLLGVLFGGVRAGLIVVALIIVVRGLGMSDADWWNESTLNMYFVPAADIIEPLVFEQLPDSVNDESSIQRRALDKAVEQLSVPTQSEGADEADQSTPQIPNNETN